MMSEDLRRRIIAWSLAIGLHAALILALMWHPPAGGSGNRLAARDEGVTVVELISLADLEAHAPMADSKPPRATMPPTSDRKSPDLAMPLPSDSPQSTGQSTLDTPSASRGGATIQQTGSAPADLSGADTQRYGEVLLAHIGRYRIYPVDARRDRLEGTVWLRFVVDRKGRVLQAWVDTSSGKILLDDEAIAAVRRAEPLPIIPVGLPDRIDITLPFNFKLE